MSNALLIPVVAPLDAVIVTPNPTLFIVTVPIHCPFEKLTELGLIVPEPVVAEIEVKLLYPVTIFPYWSWAVIVIWKPTLIVRGVAIVPNVK